MESIGTQPATLSPRELARANGVSESSSKSWINRGHIPAHLTARGHRGIDFVPALQTLLPAVEAAGAHLAWVSVGYVDDVAERRTAIAGLVAALAQ